MKLPIFVTVAFAFVSTLALAADPTPVSNGSFEITLPAGFAAFEEKTQSSKGEEGTIETHNWISKAPTGEAIVVTVSTMPGKILDPEKLMNSTRDSLLKSLNATVERQEKIEGDVPATRIFFKSAGATPVFLRARMAVRGDRMYQVLYVGRSEEQRSSAAVAGAFDSFRLAPPVQAASAQ